MSNQPLKGLFLTIDNFIDNFHKLEEIGREGETEERLRAILAKLYNLIQLFDLQLFDLARNHVELQPFLLNGSSIVSNAAIQCADPVPCEIDVKMVASFVSQRATSLVDTMKSIKSIIK